MSDSQHFDRHGPRQFLTLFLAALLMGGCAAVEDGAVRYDTLVSRLEASRSDEWSALDGAFLRLPDFQTRLEELGALHDRSPEAPPIAPADLAEQMLGLYYGDLRAHELAHRTALAASDSAKAEFHLDASRALAAVIAESGDGSGDRPYRTLSAPQAYAWLGRERMDVVGAFYEADDARRALYLVTRLREDGNTERSELRFDLTPTYRAAITLSAAIGGGESPTPSQVIATRAAQGDSAAQTAHAISLWQRGPEHATRAVNWLRAASESGNLVAREMLGVIFGSLASMRDGEEAERLLDAAVDQFLLAVNQGSSTAMYNLAQLYLSGHFGEENQPAGVTLLEQAAGRGNLDAVVMLARLHYNGQFVAKDRDRAVGLLIDASERGHTDARLFYARHLLSTDEGAGFDKRAYDWLDDSARGFGSTEAMMLLGTLHAEGEFVARDPELAVTWFRSAAEDSRDAELVNSVAWILVVAEDLALRDPDTGLALMNRLMVEDQRAAANPAYLDTWAAAHAANGDFENALRVQAEAVAIAEAEAEARGEPPPYLDVLREHLDLFRDGGTVTEDVP